MIQVMTDGCVAADRWQTMHEVGRKLGTRVNAIVAAGVFATCIAGCKTSHPVDDPTLTAQVQQRLAADSALASEPVQVIAQAGVVTLSGSVSNNAARSLAANDAAAITGVQKVINDLTVNAATAPVTSTVTTPLPQAQPLPSPAPRERIRAVPSRDVAPAPAPITRASASPVAPAYTPPPAPVRPATPPPPLARVVTLPAGSTLPVRITQTLDSATSQSGDSFSGAVATDIISDGMVLIPGALPLPVGSAKYTRPAISKALPC